MIRYPHFAFPNLYLLNGFREINSPDGVEREYESVDELEQLIRGLLIRKNDRLRGWDLRFLRRGLELSQAAFGELVDRDAQTIARWEKSSDVVPRFVDLAIRSRFVAKFLPELSVGKLIDYVDGGGEPLPDRIFLRLSYGQWMLAVSGTFDYVESVIDQESVVLIPSHSAYTNVRTLHRLFMTDAEPNWSTPHSEPLTAINIRFGSKSSDVPNQPVLSPALQDYLPRVNTIQ